MQITRNRPAILSALIGAVMLAGAAIGAASLADATPAASSDARMGELRRHCDWEACATYRCVDGACEIEAPFRY